MKILISGANGFLGGHLVPQLIKEGHGIYSLKREETGITDLLKLMNNEKFDGVIHLASLFLKDHKSEEIAMLVDSNILLGTRLLEAASISGVPWFINTGSYWQHDKNGGYAPANLYAATKQAFEDIGTFYAQAKGINFITLKLFDNFGPGDTRPKIFSIWDRISKTGEVLEMSPGEQIMDVIYIDNVVDGYMRAVELLSSDTEHKLAGKSFALSSGERMPLKELAALFERTTGHKLNINWGAKPYRPKEVMVPWQSFEALPGWKPRVSLEEGIRTTFC